MNLDIDKLSESIASGTISLPPGQTHEERRAFIHQRLKELGVEGTLEPLRKHDPEACLALVRKFIDRSNLELNDA